MKRNYLTTILLFVIQFTFAQIVNIPDINFKNALVNTNCVDTDNDDTPDTDADTNNDGEIQVSEALAVNNLWLSSYSTTSLDGIESFINLEKLLVNANNLTSLDISQNINLIRLDCYNGYYLSSLDVSQNVNLTELNCRSNQLTSLDISQNINLIKLDCWMNQLTSLDVSQNINLEELDFGRNNITSIDLSANTNLTRLYTSFNQFPTLDTSMLVNLERVWCSFNNVITSLDFSQNPNLISVTCTGNSQLATINLANGNNTNSGIYALHNPNLTCIQVDDVAWSTANWLNIDATANFNTTCPALSTDEFQETVSISIFPNPTTGSLHIESKQTLSQVIVYNLVGQQVKAFTMQADQNSIDISELKTGSYFVNVQSTSGNTYTKLIVKK